MQEKIYELLVDKDEISWKSIIFDLIRSEQMDPWDVDIKLLTQKYIEHIRELKQSNLKVSGKVVLAASMLLRVKSTKLVGDDLNEFDRLLAGSQMGEDEFYDSLEQELIEKEEKPDPKDYELLPRLPAARRRKVSVFDLVKALEKALEVKKRRVLNNAPPPVVIHKRKFDITAAIGSLFQRLNSLFSSNQKLKFSEITQTDAKEEKVYTFIPLLHLSNQEKVHLEQEKSFGEIHLSPGKKAKVEE